MRKNMFIVATIVAVAIGFTACSSSKAVSEMQKVSTKRVLVEKTPCQVLAEKKPTTRDYGEGVDFEESWAKQFAEEAARAAFQRKVESWVSSASEASINIYNKSASNGSESSKVKDQGGVRNALNKSLSEGIVRNTAVIETTTYVLADGQYQVYVCIEYLGEIGTMVSDMVSSMQKIISQQVSDDERMEILFNKAQFEKSLEEERKRFEEAKK